MGVRVVGLGRTWLRKLASGGLRTEADSGIVFIPKGSRPAIIVLEIEHEEPALFNEVQKTNFTKPSCCLALCCCVQNAHAVIT